MGIKFLCPNGHKMNVKAFLAGKRGKCPKCGTSVRIPLETPASDSGEDLLEAGIAAGPQAVSQPADQPASMQAVSVAPASPYAAQVRPAALPTGAPALPVGTVAIPASPTMTPAPAAVAPLAGDPIGQAPSAIWYVRPPSGGQYGPARGDIMRKWVAEGRVSGDSLVWREGFAEWKSAGQLFPSLAIAGLAAQNPSPPAAETVEVPKVSRVARKLSAYEARKNQGNGMAIAILVVLGIICLALVIGLVVVLSQSNNDATKDGPKKSAAVMKNRAVQQRC